MVRSRARGPKVLTITLRDLQWRARRFALGALATSLVFAATLLLGGLHAAFIQETNQTVAAFRADRWIVPAGVSGPFTQNAPLSAPQLATVMHLRGVRQATPIVLSRLNLVVHGNVQDVNIFGYPPGEGFAPKITAGRAPSAPDELALDQILAIPIGTSVTLEGRRWHVVGQVSGLTFDVGIPAALMTLPAARQVVFGGQPEASTIVTRGVPQGPIGAGLRVMTNGQVAADTSRPLNGATSAIEVVAILLFVVATGVIGLMVYLSSLDRRTDFAVFKAVGVPTSRLLGSLVVQTLLLALAAAAVAVGISALLAPDFPIPVSIGASDYLILFGGAVLVGLAASAIGVRQATAVDPALAFGGQGQQ